MNGVKEMTAFHGEKQYTHKYVLVDCSIKWAVMLDIGLPFYFPHLAYFQEEPIEEHQDEGIDEFSHKVAALRVWSCETTRNL